MLSEHQRDVLKALTYYTDRWVTPLDLGAWSRSYHSGTLKTLVRRGLVVRRDRHTRTERSFLASRGSWEYQITEAGQRALDAPPAQPAARAEEGEA